MTTCVPILLATLAALASPGPADPPGVVIELTAGRRDRRDTPVFVQLPESLAQAASLALESLDDRKPIPVQSDGRLAAWILRDPLPAGSTRRYRLSRAPFVASPTPLAGSFHDTPKSRGVMIAANNDGATASLDGQPVLTYHAAVVDPPAGIDPLYRRGGFIHPLATRSGLVLTDDFPPDHAHQHGLFFAWVNTTFDGRRLDFWNQPKKTGRVADVTDGPGTNAGPAFALLQSRLRHDDMTAPGGPEPVLDETWTVRVYDVPGLVVLDFESELRCAGPKPLTINKSIYGGFGFRGNRRWLDPTAAAGDARPTRRSPAGATSSPSEGKRRADGNHTRPRWVDLSGEVNGRFGGVAILDHPGNFRFPQPVRLHPTMPYLSFAPSVLGPFEIAPGQTYTSRYRLILHDGPPDPAALDRLWGDYADPPVARVVSEEH